MTKGNVGFYFYDLIKLMLVLIDVSLPSTLYAQLVKLH